MALEGRLCLGEGVDKRGRPFEEEEDGKKR